MEEVSWLRAVWSLLLVVGLIGIGAAILRKLAMGRAGMLAKAGERRLQLLEALPVDAKSRLVIVRCDADEHLLLISGEGSHFIKTLSPKGTP